MSKRSKNWKTKPTIREFQLIHSLNDQGWSASRIAKNRKVGRSTDFVKGILAHESYYSFIQSRPSYSISEEDIQADMVWSEKRASLRSVQAMAEWAHNNDVPEFHIGNEFVGGPEFQELHTRISSLFDRIREERDGRIAITSQLEQLRFQNQTRLILLILIGIILGILIVYS